MVHIFTDSCADLNPRLIDAHNISIIPLHVLVKDQDYLDNDLTLEELFSSVEETNELPKTAAPSVQEFITFFDTIDTKIYIGLSSELSATIQNAKLAANQLDDPNLFIIDSLNLSSGIGLLVLKAVDLRDAGLSVNDIVNEIESIKTKIRTAFVIDTMEYLYKGGRCTGLQAIFGSVLKIKPIIQGYPMEPWASWIRSGAADRKRFRHYWTGLRKICRISTQGGSLSPIRVVEKTLNIS